MPRFPSMLPPGLVLLSLALTRPASAQVPVSDWLLLGPMPAPAVSGATVDSLPEGLLSFDAAWPSEGDHVSWFNGATFTWRAQTAQAGRLEFERDERAVAYAATYVTADRWQKARIDIDGEGRRRVWLDGRTVAAEATLTQGTHLLLIAIDGEGSGGSSFTASVTPITEGARIATSNGPRRAPTLAELEELPDVTGLKADPTGERAAFLMRHTDTENDRWTTRMEIRALDDGRLIRELGLATQAMNPIWSRDGSQLAFTTTTDAQDGRGLDIWIWQPGNGHARRIVRSEPGVSSLQFSPDGTWLYFTGTQKPDSARNAITGATRLTDVWERWSYWKDKAQLYAVHTEQRTRVTLAGHASYSVVSPSLSPEGRTFVYAREVRIPERPFIRVELWLLDLSTLESRKLIDLDREAFSAPQGLAWAPDGSAVAFCASSKNLLTQDDPGFNVFETELYAVPMTRPRLVALSDQSIPSVGALGCSPIWTEDGRVHIAVQNGSHVALARSAEPVSTGALEGTRMDVLPLPAGESMGAFDVVQDTWIGAFESPVVPQVVHRVDLSTGSSVTLFDPAHEHLAQFTMPEMREWSFTDQDGWTIDGWYLTPPDFDPSAQYPMIVWYYGGTLATSRTFDRRLTAYAAQGYVVYVLNPAGAPGWGQEFSDLHVDDWGYPAGSDIIEGVTRFVAGHPFVDPDRIGNFGHSYGGFMTMHMATRTDVFAASASIAGISNIANYWGSGWTGYSYTDGTCPGCYPWNRRDVYVERSPLFRADHITAPLLLMHGTADTNVVPTESEQMFTALRVLDKEVELVRFLGENHGVNSKPSVQHNRDRMLFEWFDRYLRGRPAAWFDRWGDTDVPKAVGAATDGV